MTLFDDPPPGLAPESTDGPLPFVDYQYPIDGSGRCRLALIGEAPGAEEVRTGRPFAGRSGRLLDEMLQKAGISRDQCLVANVFRRRPPDNKVGHFFASRTKARREGLVLAERFGPFDGGGLCLDAYAPDLDHLATVLQDIGPAIAVALGRTPLWALTGLGSGLTQVRGQLLSCRLVPGIQVLASFHPSYYLRGKLGETVVFVEDLKRAAGAACSATEVVVPDLKE